MAAAAALVGSSPGGSSVMPMTTLSFLPCARLGSGVAANAATTAKIASFLNIRLLPDISRDQTKPVPHKRLTLLRRHRRQCHHRLSAVARGELPHADLAQGGRDLATMLLDQRTAWRIGTARCAHGVRGDRRHTAAAPHTAGPGTRNGFEQRARIGMGAVREQILRAALFDNA